MNLDPAAALALLAAPVALGAGAWVIRRWLSRLDTHLAELQKTLSEMRVKSAVADERYSKVLGIQENLQAQVSALTKDVGRLAGAVEKLWTILEVKGLIPARASDQILREAGGK
jgi:hypothetical protein